MRIILTASTVLLLGTTRGSARVIPTIQYERALGRFPEPLSQIVGFRAMDRDRAIVADGLEGHGALLDWRDGSIVDISPQGGGPGDGP